MCFPVIGSRLNNNSDKWYLHLVDKSARSWLFSFYFTTITTVGMSYKPSYSYYLQGLQLRKFDDYFSLSGGCTVPFRIVKSTQHVENSRSVPAWFFFILYDSSMPCLLQQGLIVWVCAGSSLLAISMLLNV